MLRRRAFALVVLAAIVLLGVAPQVAPTARAQAAGKVLRVSQGSMPDLDAYPLDPQRSCCYNQIAASSLDYEGLTRLDERLATVPAAAESWEFSPDGTVLTFHLRAGLTYADGSPLTAERFRYAIERTCDPRTAAPYASVLFDIVGCEALNTSLEAAPATTPGATPAAAVTSEVASTGLGVRAVDDWTLEIQLTQPAAYFPTVASLWVFYPVKQEAVAADPDGWWRDPASRVGNGPFRATRLDVDEPDQRFSFAANERYWGGRPRLDGIDYVFFPEGADEAGLNAYQAGEVDIASFPARLLPTVAADPVLGAELLRYPFASTTTLAFNLTKAPFQDKAVREAFAYAFDRAAYCREIAHGTCEPTLTWIPPGVPGQIETDAYAFDPEAARQALTASSYGGPEQIPEIVWYYGEEYPDAQTEAEWLAEQYREVLGVELRLTPMPADAIGAMFNVDAATTPQLSFGGWFQDYPDPQNWLSLVWTCASFFAQTVGYCNPQVDALVEQGDQELDPAKRLAPYEEAQQLLIADVPAAFLFNPLNVWLVKPRVVGYATTPSDLWPGWASVQTLDLVSVPATPAA